VSTTVLRLSSVILVLAVVAAASGLFWQGSGQPFTFTTLHGETVQVHGRGLYRYDSVQKAAIFRGTDVVTLLICTPLLALSLVLYGRGSLRGAVLLTSVLAFFLYNSASLAFGAAYNQLFLLYVALFSTSLFAFVLAFGSIDLRILSASMSERLPRRGIALFLAVAGLVLLVVWLADILGAFIAGGPLPTLQTYTTEVTYVIDLGLLAPAALLAALLIRCGSSLGYLLAAVMLVLNGIIGLVIVAQTVMMQLEGLTLSAGQIVAYVASFVVLSVIALWLAVILFRNISDPTPRPQ
jgi:hypothetical protein